MTTSNAYELISTGQARRLAREYSFLGQGMHIFSRAGQTTMLARSELVRPDTAGARDPQGMLADCRALAEWMDNNFVPPSDWATAYDDAVVPWGYRGPSK